MTNFNPNNLPSKQRGITIIFTTVVILFLATILIVNVTESSVTNQLLVANSIRTTQAFEAAEAGLEFGILFLKENQSIVNVDTNNDGYIDAFSSTDVTNVGLANNSKFSVTYSNPTQNDFDIIEVTSIGTSDDDSVTRTIKQAVSEIDYVQNKPPVGVIAHKNIDLSGNVSITNTETGLTMWSGGSVNLAGGASTDGGGGISSDVNGLSSDVVQNDTALSSLSGDDFFFKIFNMNKVTSKSRADIVYNNSSDTNYSSLLDGVKKKIIWISQSAGEAQLSGNSVIGSLAEPVVLIVDGDFKANGNTTVYGFVYITKDWHNSGGGTLRVFGSIAMEGSLTGTGTPNVTYSNEVNDNLDFVSEFAKIPGSWIDL